VIYFFGNPDYNKIRTSTSFFVQMKTGVTELRNKMRKKYKELLEPIVLDCGFQKYEVSVGKTKYFYTYTDSIYYFYKNRDIAITIALQPLSYSVWANGYKIGVFDSKETLEKLLKIINKYGLIEKE
jgi:hypothetical protein